MSDQQPMSADSLPSDTDVPRSKPSSLLSAAVDRPVSVLVGVLLVTLFGAITFFSIPIQLTPDISTPQLFVQTFWPGASPVEIESEIIEEQEEVLKNLPGLVRMVSNASPGGASVTLQLEVGTDLQESLVRASNLLSQVPRYPDNAQQPVLATADPTGNPVGVMLLRHKQGAPMRGYRTWVEDIVVPLFKRIPGVANVPFRGGQASEIEIIFDSKELAGRGITLGQVAERIRAELRDISGGDVTLGKRRILVRTPVAPEEPQGFERVVIATNEDGVPTRLGDVATVRMGIRKPDFTVYTDGHETLALFLIREAGANVLEIDAEARATMQKLQSEYLDPLGLEISMVTEQASYIYSALDLVKQNLVLGGLFAVVVLLVFLRNIVASLVVAVAIPICVVATALGMALLGRSVNVVSLAGMAFAVGMVVDNAIVVLENIETWRNRGFRDKLAAVTGVREVWGAIFASTATTAAVFLPIVFWQGEVGELLRDIAIAISISVVISLVVSVLVIPSFSAALLSRERTGSFSLGRLETIGTRFKQLVKRLVFAVVEKRWRSLTVAGGAVAITSIVAVFLLTPLEYLPIGNRNLIFGFLSPPAGYSFEEMDRIGKKVEAHLLEHTRVEKDGVPALFYSFFLAGAGSGMIGAEAENPEELPELLSYIQGLFGEIPGVSGFAVRSSLFGRSIGSGRSVEIEVTGRDLEPIVDASERIMAKVREALPGAQARPIPSLDLSSPELHVKPDREQLTAVGMNGSELGLVVDSLVDGAIIGEYSREGEARINVVMKPVGSGIQDPSDLASAPVATPNGQTLPLSVLADIEERLGPTRIYRIERRRGFTIQVQPPESIPLETAVATIRDDVIAPLEADGVLGNGVDTTLEGSAGDLRATKTRFLSILLLAVAISFLLMAALFEDFLAPTVVMVTLPLAAAGGMLGLRLVDATLGKQPLDMVTALGFVILIGVVVNNAILVVDGALTRLRRNDPLEVAITEAVLGRVRPIFMSALTSIAGLLPLVIFPGSGSELYRGIGAVVLGGLALSTVLTLFVVPALFSLLWAGRVRAAGFVLQGNSDEGTVVKGSTA